jgi:hypothetical protein
MSMMSLQEDRALARAETARGNVIPKGWYWLGASLVSVALWWAMIKGVVALI